MDCSLAGNVNGQCFARLNEARYQQLSDILVPQHETSSTGPAVTFNQPSGLLNLASNNQPSACLPKFTWQGSLTSMAMANTIAVSSSSNAFLPPKQQKQASSQPMIDLAQVPLTHVRPKSCANQDSFETMVTNLPLSDFAPEQTETVTLPVLTSSSSSQLKKGSYQRAKSMCEKQQTCSDDVVFLGEVEKPELKDNSSDIIFVRNTHNRSGVVCLTPNRKLRRQKSAPYRVSVDNDTTEFKVTISQKKGSSTTTVSNNEWSYGTASGLKLFDPNTTSFLEHLYVNRSGSDSNITITLPRSGESYNVNMEKLTMTSVRSGEEVYLLRIPCLQNEIDVAPPSSCLGDFPTHWSPQVNDIELVEIGRTFNFDEWMTIEDEMRKTLPTIRIDKIERVQNKKLWIRYAFQKAMLIDKNLGIVNEKMLFHGTRANPPWKIYQSEDGFDMRYSRNGAWGCGTYFAENAAYSHDYAHVPSWRSSTSSRQMFTATVLTGNSIDMFPDKGLRRPPVRIPATSIEPEVLYDSVTGTAHSGIIPTRIYVLYKFDMAYPSYLVTYSTQ